jgi:hypothetical protein
VRYLREPPALPGREPDRTYADVRVWSSAEGLFLQYASDVRAHATATEAIIGGGTEHLDHAFSSLFHPAITYLLALHGRFVVHAAAFARRSRALVVLGTSGAGKSTLALAALGAGWQLLGDDLVVVKQEAGRLKVAGIARRTALPTDLATEALTEGKPLRGDHRNRWELAGHRLQRGWFPLAGVLFAAHSRGPGGELHRCQPARVFDAALASFTSATDPARLRRFFPCAAALARLPAWELSLAADPTARLPDAARDLEVAAAALDRSPVDT